MHGFNPLLLAGLLHHRITLGDRNCDGSEVRLVDYGGRRPFPARAVFLIRASTGLPPLHCCVPQGGLGPAECQHLPSFVRAVLGGPRVERAADRLRFRIFLHASGRSRALQRVGLCPAT